MTNENPLLKSSQLKNRALPFPEYQNSHYLPAVEASIEEARKNITKIKQQPEPTFENTIVALESASEDLDLIVSTFHSLLGAHSNDEMQGIAQELGPLVSAYSSDVTLDNELFACVEKVWEARADLSLNQEDARLLEETYDSFVRNGAKLPDNKRTRLREIDQRLSVLGPKFGENVLKETNAFEMFVSNEGDLAGLPDSAKEAAAQAAEAKGKPGQWLFTLHAPSLLPFLQYAENRDLREKMWRAYGSRAFQSEFSNEDIVIEIVKLRNERAQLLGFETHAHYVLNKRMAQTPEKVFSFLDKLKTASKPAEASAPCPAASMCPSS